VKYVLIGLAAMGLLTAGLAVLSPVPNGVPEALIGIWEGRAWDASGELNGGADLPFLMTIGLDGAVECTLGDAVFVECRAHCNRGWLGRVLNIKTDYIIKGGYLQGAVTPEDAGEVRSFTLPLSPEREGFRGTIMVLKPWTYPYPLLRVDLRASE